MPQLPLNQKKQRRGGIYWNPKDGKPYLSVTHILSIIEKEGLRYWFGEQVYWGMVEDPTLDKKTALALPYQKSNKAKDRGTTIHSVIEMWKQSQRQIKGLPEALRGYADAFYKWVDQENVEILDQEKTVFSLVHKTAGTLDLRVKLGKSKRKMIIDSKTSEKGVWYPETQLQLSAYWDMLEEEADGIAVLVLDPKGNFNYKEFDQNVEAFLAAKTLFLWKNPDIATLMEKYWG